MGDSAPLQRLRRTVVCVCLVCVNGCAPLRRTMLKQNAVRSAVKSVTYTTGIRTCGRVQCVEWQGSGGGGVACPGGTPKEC